MHRIEVYDIDAETNEEVLIGEHGPFATMTKVNEFIEHYFTGTDYIIAIKDI